jgi:hypothetical protein
MPGEVEIHGQMQGARAAGYIEGGRASRRQESASPPRGGPGQPGFDAVSKQRATGRELLLPPLRFGSAEKVAGLGDMPLGLAPPRSLTPESGRRRRCGNGG